jgi:hypothetical protein
MTTVAYGSLASKDATTRAEWAARQAMKFGDNLAGQASPRGGTGATNVYPYFFAEMTVAFGLPVNENQFNCTMGDGDTTPGRYNTWPELTVNPLGGGRSDSARVLDLRPPGAPHTYG